MCCMWNRNAKKQTSILSAARNLKSHVLKFAFLICRKALGLGFEPLYLILTNLVIWFGSPQQIQEGKAQLWAGLKERL